MRAPSIPRAPGPVRTWAVLHSGPTASATRTRAAKPADRTLAETGPASSPFGWSSRSTASPDLPPGAIRGEAGRVTLTVEDRRWIEELVRAQGFDLAGLAPVPNPETPEASAEDQRF